MNLVPVQTFGNQVNPLLAQRQAMGQPLGTPRILQAQQGRLVDMGKSPEYLDAMFNQQIFRDDRINQNQINLEGLKQRNALAANQQKFGFDKDVEGLRSSNNRELQKIKEAFEIERSTIRENFARDENDRVYQRDMEDLDRREKAAQLRFENNLKKELTMREASESRRAEAETARQKELMTPFIPGYQKGLNDFNAWFRGVDNGSPTKRQFRDSRIQAYKARNGDPNDSTKYPTPEERRAANTTMNLFIDRAEQDKEKQIADFHRYMIANPIPGMETIVTQLKDNYKSLDDRERELQEQLLQETEQK